MGARMLVGDRAAAGRLSRRAVLVGSAAGILGAFTAADGRVRAEECGSPPALVPPAEQPPPRVPPDGAPPAGPPPQESITVTRVPSTYALAPRRIVGPFATGQSADIALSAIDFNNTGGPLLFHHQAGIATDGTRLALADRNNNRVLLWSKLPLGNTAPDLVLGQASFTTNNPGAGPAEMNWPVGVSLADGKLAVADAYNDRILIWTAFPTRSGQAADLVMNGVGDPALGTQQSKDRFIWPWGVWTDGRRLAVSTTGLGAILIWNEFPTRDRQAADLLLTGGGQLGTPRLITSDGRSLIVGDHNPRIPGIVGQGSFVWTRFPSSDDAPPDYFLQDPVDPRAAWLQGAYAPDGRLLLLGRTLHVWRNVPASAGEAPALSIQGYDFNGGDGSDIAIAGERVYISASNSNKVLGYHRLPTARDQKPDFAIGSPDINTNTLDTNFLITNPAPATDGTSLWAVSDFDGRMCVWSRIPDQSGAHPDFVYKMPRGAWAVALHDTTLATVGRELVHIWQPLPRAGELPVRTLRGGIGDVRFQELRGVAIDAKYFYLADKAAGRIHVWRGVPAADTNTAFSVDVGAGVTRISSDGRTLVACMTEVHATPIKLFDVATLDREAQPTILGGRQGTGQPPGGIGRFNLPQDAIPIKNGIAVADTAFNRVQIWRDLAAAVSGRDPDVILGARTLGDRTAEIGRDKLFFPGALAFDGTYLWVGEFKFSGRLLRFSGAG